MNDSDRQLLLAVSGLLHYPEDDFFVQARSFEELCDLLSVVRACPLREFIRSARSKGLSRLREEHVAIFDMDSKCSLSLAWHRYGDDPRLGRALAGLNELYRDAGFEPVQGLLPDYLPLVLEFLSAAPDWARVVLLDGFGKELIGIYAALEARHPVPADRRGSRPCPGSTPSREAFGASLGGERVSGEEEETFLSVGLARAVSLSPPFLPKVSG